MYKKIIQAAAFTFTLALSPVVLAHSGGCGEGLKKMVESLKLDDSQKSKIKPILEQLKSTMKNDVTQMRDISQQLNQQAESANMDQSTVDSLVDKKTKLIGDMIKAKITAKNQIYAVLNPQQKTELQNKWKKVEEKMAEKFKACHDE
ncbi:envelope stress induced periplasmic protein [Legionella steigerwaltii]|uniref:Envelope stress induced periplasmic protein n=1 Tax=Legionella steigerwaltii TaxID=460 RepID=A0A378L9M3_9GAMM|nr:Spy/CpxP family protein refolding chaperone [Legionella steigerwaltii]KTD77710.1 envelope stress induced periplasmic protein [Legionella steigerwaltii]STY23020.1 envelope stress induced periplasmic protein [Legionella steigerwaltii]